MGSAPQVMLAVELLAEFAAEPEADPVAIAPLQPVKAYAIDSTPSDLRGTVPAGSGLTAVTV